MRVQNLNSRQTLLCLSQPSRHKKFTSMAVRAKLLSACTLVAIAPASWQEREDTHKNSSRNNPVSSQTLTHQDQAPSPCKVLPKAAVTGRTRPLPSLGSRRLRGKALSSTLSALSNKRTGDSGKGPEVNSDGARPQGGRQQDPSLGLQKSHTRAFSRPGLSPS